MDDDEKWNLGTRENVTGQNETTIYHPLQGVHLLCSEEDVELVLAFLNRLNVIPIVE